LISTKSQKDGDWGEHSIEQKKNGTRKAVVGTEERRGFLKKKGPSKPHDIRRQKQNAGWKKADIVGEKKIHGVVDKGGTNPCKEKGKN